MSDQDNNISNALIQALLSERRTARWWSGVRTVLWLLVVIVFLYMFFAPSQSVIQNQKSGPYVSLVRLSGIIMPGAQFSAYKASPALIRAFRDPNAKGVLLEINSPGGTPVQAQIIHDQILYLKHKYKKKVVVLGQDSLASGAYLVSTAADKIVVHPDTVTGSIGVIMSGFGFTGAIHKLGITRRVFTAGTNKDRMDAFRPLSPADKAKVERILTEVHQNFISDVKAGRKGKLRGSPAELFSGDFWTGTTAVKLGLADNTGNVWTVLHQDFKVNRFRDYSARPSLLEFLLKGTQTMLHFHLQSAVAPLQEQFHY